MEDRKKPIMIGVIVVCLVVAGLITFARRGGSGGGIGSIPESEMIWVKCNNPDCKAEYQMSKREYYEEQKKRFNPLARSTPALTCKECGKDSLYKAVKCENCGYVFIEGISGQNDFPDRCPKCKHSATEDSRKRRRSGQE
jgi:predicted Zn-ribbon and HTH transcriptional regulator